MSTLQGMSALTESADGRWHFAIDRGGTFTDIVARRPDGGIVVQKLLSVNPERYRDAAIQGIRDLLGLAADHPIPVDLVADVKMGTTVATNALLERRGDRTLLLITAEFRDALRIGYQDRPDLYSRRIVLPELLCQRVAEVNERYSAQGEELISVDLDRARDALRSAYCDGFRSCAIVLLHGYRYPDHEKAVAALAREIGYDQVSVSHEVSPLMRLVSRGDTTVIDAYLAPVLRRYLSQVTSELPGIRVMFMQSNGGLVEVAAFQAKNSLLSGPAGGVVGAVQTSRTAGFTKIISFDMGGTSTDVAHCDGDYERAVETEIAGVRLQGPVMAVHTIAAGGGSILRFHNGRFRVGPGSAGADPGPACYRRGRPLTVTDANVMVGKLQPDFFPRLFGESGNLALDGEIVRTKFGVMAAKIAAETGDPRAPEEVAQGFLSVAVENMANALKRISLQRGYNVTDYTLCCFGGAGGQHACLIADSLGMRRVVIHPHAGVLSAYGIGLADLRVMREQPVEARLADDLMPALQHAIEELAANGITEIRAQGLPDPRIHVIPVAHLRYEGTDYPLLVDFASPGQMRRAFEATHRQRYGFAFPGRALIVEALSVEVVGDMPHPDEPVVRRTRYGPLARAATVRIYTSSAWWDADVFDREQIQPGDRVVGPAIIIEATATSIVEPGWRAEMTDRSHLVLTRTDPLPNAADTGTGCDPVMLEVLNGRFRSIAEQMGATLQNTSQSVNIKERLDFSCAIFDAKGRLVAAAHHIPVHLGSMSESVQALITERGGTLRPGDAYITNDPFRGGTHLPDITAITPVFDDEGRAILFFTASRGHHADIGGMSPGSMPPGSRTLDEEGVVIRNFLLLAQGRLQEQELLQLLSLGLYPARNPQQNLADLCAQAAANERGAQALRTMVQHFGLETVQVYMEYVQANAEDAVRRAIAGLAERGFSGHSQREYLDDGSCIQVTVTVDSRMRGARVDFTGTSPQQPGNFNAPAAVSRAAVLYVFRTLPAAPPATRHRGP